MGIFQHLTFFVAATILIWVFSGMLVESVARVAKRFNQSGFTVAFFVLGFLTSISEFSVMINSTIDGVPQISAGNLAGASIVILLFIVPFLAVLSNGIQLRDTLNGRQLALALFAVALPTLFMLDGGVTLDEGVVCLVVYAMLLYLIRKNSSASSPEIIKEVEEDLVNKRRLTFYDGAKILFGAAVIFFAGNLLVEEALFFSGFLSVPSSIIGLVILSLGTNIPELVIAVRSIRKKRSDIAFGDYIGSAVANTVIFSLLPFFNGPFQVERTEFAITGFVMMIGFTAFYFFARSGVKISRKEGIVLVCMYFVFFVVQAITLIRFATN